MSDIDSWCKQMPPFKASVNTESVDSDAFFGDDAFNWSCPDAAAHDTCSKLEMVAEYSISLRFYNN